MTISVVARLTVKPGSGAAFEEIVAAARPGVLQEPGCRRYDLQLLRKSEGDYVMLEIWDSPADLGVHGKSEGLARFGERIADLLAAPVQVEVYDPVGEQVPLGA